MDLGYIISAVDSAAPSQVFALLTSLSKRDDIDSVYLLSPHGVPEKYVKGFEVVTYSTIPFLNRTHMALSYTSKSLKKALIRCNLRDEAIIHTRGPFSTFAALATGAPQPIVTDFRGLAWAEYALYHPRTLAHLLMGRYKLGEIKRIEKMAYRQSDGVSCVSDCFEQYMADNWGSRDDVIVNPSSADERYFSFNADVRHAYRKRLGIAEDDILLLFSTGGNSAWQNITSTKTSLDKLHDPRIKLLVLTTHALKFQSLASKRVIVESSEYEDVFKYLNAADAGLLFRDDNPVNHVASPIKVSEYLCCGLPMLLNRSVQSSVRYVTEYSAGVIVDSIEQIKADDLSFLVSRDRQHIASRAQQSFGLTAVAENYMSLYNRLRTSRLSK